MPILQMAAAGFVDGSGDPLANGKLYFYEVGTTDNTTSYQDAELSLSHAQPVVLRNDGTQTIYFNGKVRIDVYDANDNLIVSLAEVGTALLAQDVEIDQSLTDGAHDDFDATNVDAVLASAIASMGGRNWKYKSSRSANTYERTIAAKLQTVIDLADYVNETGSNANQALENAIADLPSGSASLFIPAGTYTVTDAKTLNNLTNVHIFGEGAASIIRQSGDSYNLFDLTGSCSNISFDNLQLQGGGDSASTAALGIVAGGSCTDISVRNVRFSGPANGTGFNIAVKSEAVRTHLYSCHFDRVQNNSAGIGVSYIVGCEDSTVEFCHFDNTDGKPGSAVILSQAHRSKVVGCRVIDASDSGIEVYLTEEAQVLGCNVSDCDDAGIDVMGSPDAVLADNICNNNTTDGVRISYSLTSVGSHRCNVSDNHLINNTRNGLRVDNDGTNATSIPDHAKVSGNVMYANGQEGIWTAGDYGTYEGNHLIENSNTDNGGVQRGTSAIEVTTVNVGGHTGGNENVFMNNRVREDAGTQEHRSCIRIRAAGGGVTNVSSTRFHGNDFPPQATNGTPRVWEYGVSTSSPPGMGWNSNGLTSGVATSYPWEIITGDRVLTADDAGKVFLIDLSAAAADFTITMPVIGSTDLDYRAHLEYEFIVTQPNATYNADLTISGTSTFLDSSATAGTTISNALGGTAHAALKLRAIQGTSPGADNDWMVISKEGTWTIA